jgi:hypothetical protein
MNLNARAILGLSLLLCCLYACKKNNDAHPSTGNSGTSGTGTLSFSTPADTAEELIVSDSGGKVLLDTVFLNNGTFSTTLHTSDTLVDVTLIGRVDGFGGPPDYLVSTYKAVNLARWQTDLPGNYVVPLGTLPAHTTANLTYINAPFISTYLTDPYFYLTILFSDMPLYDVDQTFKYDPGVNNGPATISYQYNQYGNDLDYILFESSGQYKFHTHVTDNDTVDLTEMDTAVIVTFSRPAEYAKIVSCSLVGYWDTTNNYTNSTLLYSQSIQRKNARPTS